MTEQIDTADLREKLAAATPGPWEGWRQYSPLRGTQTGITTPDGDTDIIASSGALVEDIVLIEAAVNALPALLDEIERLRAVTDEHVEAAARAMFAEEQCDRTQKATAEGLEQNWQSRLSDEDRDEYRMLARAALEAARQAGGTAA